MRAGEQVSVKLAPESLTLLQLKFIADLESQQLQVHRLLEHHDPPDATQAVWELLADETSSPGDIPQRAGNFRAEPVVDSIGHGVEGRVRGVHGDACGGAAEEGSLQGVIEREGCEGLEDWRVVGDDERCWGRQCLLYHCRCETDRIIARESTSTLQR